MCYMSNEKLFFSPLCSVHTDANRFIYPKIIIKNPFFHFYFLNRVFYFTIISPTL